MWPLVKSDNADGSSAGVLDDMSSEAHICLGMESGLFDRRWQEAGAHFQKAIERDAYSGGGHLWHALAFLIPMRRLEEAQAGVGDGASAGSGAVPRRGGASGGVPGASSTRKSWVATRSKIRRRAAVVDGAVDAKLRAGRNRLHRGSNRRGLNGSLRPGRGRADQTMTLSTLRICVRNRRAIGIKRSTLWSRAAAKAVGWVVGILNYDLAVHRVRAYVIEEQALIWLHEALREKEPWMAFLSLDPRLSSLRDHSKYAGLAGRIVSDT